MATFDGISCLTVARRQVIDTQISNNAHVLWHRSFSSLRHLSSRGDSFMALLSRKVSNECDHCSSGSGITHAWSERRSHRESGSPATAFGGPHRTRIPAGRGAGQVQYTPKSLVVMLELAPLRESREKERFACRTSFSFHRRFTRIRTHPTVTFCEQRR